jgi:cation diffusion facilitator CzcD-associated flavoprotein CzcO
MVDLAGKTVGVMGPGASANQIVPSIADLGDNSTIFMMEALAR